ncbi:F-box only protein 33-like [Arapaima gigas]
MALCGGVGASALPSELIVHIFSFLSARDKLRASAVCSRWRECLFYPALWTELKLRVGGGASGGGSGCDETPKLEFLMRKFGSFVRELQLEFAPVDGLLPLHGEAAAAEASQSGGTGSPERWKDAMKTYLEQALCVLRGLRHNRNLQKLSLYGDTCILQDEGVLDTFHLNQVDQGGKKIKEIQQLFKEILANSRQLKWLSSVFMLGMVTPNSLVAMSNPSASSLEHLSLLDNQVPSLVPAVELERLLHLRSLALEFSDFSAAMCRLLCGRDHVPLHRLSLLLNGAALPSKPLDGTPLDEDWKALVRHSANLRVYVLALDTGSQDLLAVLKPSIPLERIHFDNYSACTSEAAVELISLQYHKTLTHFILMRDDAGFPDLSDNRNEDPLVLLAWRCVHLSVLVIHGYTVWAHNLIAISRLRGSNLKVLAVSEESIDFDPDQVVFLEEEPVHNLIKEVSQGLGRVWHPVMDTSIVLSEPTQHFFRESSWFSYLDVWAQMSVRYGGLQASGPPPPSSSSPRSASRRKTDCKTPQPLPEILLVRLSLESQLPWRSPRIRFKVYWVSSAEEHTFACSISQRRNGFSTTVHLQRGPCSAGELIPQMLRAEKNIPQVPERVAWRRNRARAPVAQRSQTLLFLFWVSISSEREGGGRGYSLSPPSGPGPPVVRGKAALSPCCFLAGITE